MAAIDVTTRKKIRNTLKKIKSLDHGFVTPCPHCQEEIEMPGLKEMEKQKNNLRDFLKEFDQNLDYPEGKTEWREFDKVSYDYNALEELMESGAIDSDTAALIRRCKKVTPVRSMYIL